MPHAVPTAYEAPKPRHGGPVTTGDHDMSARRDSPREHGRLTARSKRTGPSGHANWST